MCQQLSQLHKGRATTGFRIRPWGRIWPRCGAQWAPGPQSAMAKAGPVAGGRGQALPAATSRSPGTKTGPPEHRGEPHGAQSPFPPPRPGRLPRPTANPPRRESAKPHGHAAPPLHRGWPGQAGALLRTEPGRDRGGGGETGARCSALRTPKRGGCVCVGGGGGYVTPAPRPRPPFPAPFFPAPFPMNEPRAGRGRAKGLTRRRRGGAGEWVTRCP